MEIEAPATIPIAPVRPAPTPLVSFERCELPTTSELPDHYLSLASTICEQRAATYSNVLLFVTPEPKLDAAFSITWLAQAFALQSSGDVLLVDGDLRNGKLSKSVCPGGPGMIEVMLGTSAWTDVIHPTASSRIDFVAHGNCQVPTFDRPEFGWGAAAPISRGAHRAVRGGRTRDRLAVGTLRCRLCRHLRPHTRRQVASAAVNELRSVGANVQGCVVVND